MFADTTDSSLISQIIKIFRTTSEPLSAHAISEQYGVSYSRIRRILRELEEDGIVTSIKTGGGRFYFIPDKYFSRGMDSLVEREKLPTVWLEDFTDEELSLRAQKLQKELELIQEKYDDDQLSVEDFYSKRQQLKEELGIVKGMIKERRERNRTPCFYCKKDIEDSSQKKCEHCHKKIPLCIVCDRGIFANEPAVQCPFCNDMAHTVHFQEWLRNTGKCPKCKTSLRPEQLLPIKEGKQ
jgi:DNA-binding transcriptional regulator GbsR (MarR family)